MAPVKKHNITSKVNAKRRAESKDQMELLEEGLYMINVSRAMDIEAPTTPRDFMQITSYGAQATRQATRQATGIPPPCALTRSTNSAALLTPPFPLLPSAAGIV